MNDLPHDILLMVLEHINDYDDLIAVSRVNHRFSGFIREHRLLDRIPFPHAVWRAAYPDKVKLRLHRFIEEFQSKPHIRFPKLEKEKDGADVNVVVCGDTGVGKSASTIKFINGIFVDRYDPTIEDSYRKCTNLGDPFRDASVIMEILDSSNTFRERISPPLVAKRDMYFRNCHCLIVLFDVTRPATMDSLHSYVESYRKSQPESETINVVLVAHKIDLEAKVPRWRGLNAARELQACYIESSSKTSLHNYEVFTEAARLGLALKMERFGALESNKIGRCQLF